jgi:hypothetical protein
MTGAVLDFAQLVDLVGDKTEAATPCPLCSAARRPANRRKPVLHVWRKGPDFATYSCAHCGAHGWASDRAAKPVTRTEITRRMREAQTHQQAALAKRQNAARWLWAQSRDAQGTIVETYLAGRGINVCPRTVRFLPGNDKFAPCMIAAFALPAEHPVLADYETPGTAVVQGVHLTRLAPDGSGKAPDQDSRAKIMVGPSAGWPLALVPPGDLGGLAVAEGIEDALSLHQATELGVWAAGAAGRLPKLAPVIARLRYIEAVTVAVDDDDGGRRGAQQLAAELRRLRGRSIEVSTVAFAEVRHEAA